MPGRSGAAKTPAAPADAAGMLKRIGQAAVEFAMVVPLLCLIIVAILHFGKVMNYWLDLNHVASEGARKAAVNTFTSDGAYDTYLRAGSAGALAQARGLDQLGFWRALAEHTSYDWWWQVQAVDKVLAKEPLTVPTMNSVATALTEPVVLP